MNSGQQALFICVGATAAFMLFRVLDLAKLYHDSAFSLKKCSLGTSPHSQSLFMLFCSFYLWFQGLAAFDFNSNVQNQAWGLPHKSGIWIFDGNMGEAHEVMTVSFDGIIGHNDADRNHDFSQHFKHIDWFERFWLICIAPALCWSWPVLAVPGAILGGLGAPLKRSWDLSGRSWGFWGTSGSILGGKRNRNRVQTRCFMKSMFWGFRGVFADLLGALHLPVPPVPAMSQIDKKTLATPFSPRALPHIPPRHRAPAALTRPKTIQLNPTLFNSLQLWSTLGG